MKLLDVRDYIVRPTLARLGLAAANREQLVTGTGNTESQYNFLDQTTEGPGPAYGAWQMEKPTHDDLWANFINFQPSAFRDEMLAIAGTKYAPPVELLHGNWFYGAAMCAVHYRRVRAPLPAAGDVAAMAAYWKQWYNTPKGRGTVDRALPFFKQVCDL